MSERERGGRRRRLYRLTPQGRDALGQVALRVDRRALRAPRPGSAEALLRRRPGRRWPRPSSLPTARTCAPSSSCARRRRRRTCPRACGSRSRPGSATRASTCASGRGSASASSAAPRTRTRRCTPGARRPSTSGRCPCWRAEQEPGVVVERPPVALGADLDHRQDPAVVDAQHLRRPRCSRRRRAGRAAAPCSRRGRSPRPRRPRRWSRRRRARDRARRGPRRSRRGRKRRRTRERAARVALTSA